MLGTLFRIGMVAIAIVVIISQFKKDQTPVQTNVNQTIASSVVQQQKSVCNPDQFIISNQRFTIYDACTLKSCPILKVVGKVKNGCSEPYGVELRVTAYSKSGDVIDTATGWPFSVRNLEANSSEEFDMDQIFPYQKSMKSFAMQAVDTRHWK